MTRVEIMNLARQADLDWHKHWDDEENRLERFAVLVAAAEREECAKIAEKMLRFYTQGVTGVAEAIRARGEE